MHSTLVLAALAAVVYAAPAPAPIPQAVTQPVGPSASAPAGCTPSYNGKFQIAAVNVTSTGKRSVEARQSSCDAPGSLTLSLAGGTLTDSQGRIGCIVANYQFQFDGPPQAGTIYNTGFSTCSNNTLALGGSTIFYQCLSGDFYNLYDRSFAPHCNAVYLQILPCSAGGSSGAPGGVGQGGDGQPTGTGVGAPPVTQIADGQVQASTGKPTVTQIGDGQIQVPTGRPVTQIGDGQIQAPTGKPISQISDGQIQAPTNQPTATSKPAPITQISDGQIQVPTSKPAPITQISDGQIQAPTQSATASSRAPVVTQIGDGQIQVPTNASSTVIPFTGSASVAIGNSAMVVTVFGLLSILLL